MGIALEFLPNQAGENEGLGDAGIETFRDDPYASCGRESGQNSRDASLAFPVRMTFDVLDVPRADLPGYTVLNDTVAVCLAAAGQEKDRDFFERAASVLEQPTIRVLRIADFNTKGLVGPSDQEGTPFHSLLKGAGITSKETETSGGSFGIGKNASFAVSELQTVLYATRYAVADGTAFAAQGKVRLVSHTDPDGERRRATGYWGNTDGYSAITDSGDVPSWMQRDEIGTSIFSVGFRSVDGWACSIAYSLLINFFTAIERREMAFEIDNSAIRINHNTIAALFRDEAIRRAAEDAGQLSQLEFSEQLHRGLTSPDAIETEASIAGLGKVRFRVLVDEDLPKRVGIVRNGMLITTGLQHFGDRLERFVGMRQFVALVEPADNAASKLLKSMENPRHDGFSAARLADPAKRENATAAMKHLIRQLRNWISEQAAIAQDGETVIEELSRYFATEASGGTPPDAKAEPDPEKYVYKPPKQVPKPARQTRSDDGNEGGGGTDGTGQSGGRRNGTERGPGAGTGGTGTSGKVPPLRLKGVRTSLAGTPGQERRRILFTPTASGRATIRVEATGINSGEALDVTSSNAGALSGGAIDLDLVDGTRVELEVGFDSPYAGPIEVLAALQSGADQ